VRSYRDVRAITSGAGLLQSFRRNFRDYPTVHAWPPTTPRGDLEHWFPASRATPIAIPTALASSLERSSLTQEARGHRRGIGKTWPIRNRAAARTLSIGADLSVRIEISERGSRDANERAEREVRKGQEGAKEGFTGVTERSVRNLDVSSSVATRLTKDRDFGESLARFRSIGKKKEREGKENSIPRAPSRALIPRPSSLSLHLFVRRFGCQLGRDEPAPSISIIRRLD